MACAKNSFALAKEAFLCKSSERPYVQLLVFNLHGLVIHIMVLGAQLKQHDMAGVKAGSQPGISLAMQNQQL